MVLFGQLEQNLPTPISQPPSWEHACTAMQHTHPQKYICKYLKIAKFSEITFYILKMRERV